MPGQSKGLNPAKRWAMPVNRINVEHCIPLEGAVAQERGVSVVCTTQKQHRLCAQGAAVRKRPYSLALECCWLGQVLRECVRHRTQNSNCLAILRPSHHRGPGHEQRCP